MTLSRKHRRALRIGPLTYHYQVRPAREGGVSLVVVPTEGNLRAIQTRFRAGTVVTPGLVRRFVEEALAQGWNTQTTPDQRNFDERSAPSAARFVDGDRRLVEARAVARVSGERPPCPWPQSPMKQGHHELSGTLGEAETGDLLASWCGPYVRATPTASLRAMVQRPPYLPGGLRWRVDGDIHTEPGCCITLGERGDWLSCLGDGGFWGGHDPWVGVEVRETAVVIHPGTSGERPLSLTRQHYLDVLRDAESALRAFADNLESWVSGVAPECKGDVVTWFRQGAALD